MNMKQREAAQPAVPSVAVEDVVSVAEVQPEALPAVIYGAQEVVPNGANLEPETSPRLDSEENVADKPDLGPFSTVQTGLPELQDLLNQSMAKVNEAVKEAVTPTVTCDGRLASEMGMIKASSEAARERPHGTVENPLLVAERSDFGFSLDIEPGALIGTAKVFSIGDQPNGDLIVPVTIDSEYAEAVRQWAEAEGFPVSEWLSRLLRSYLESYGQPARGR